MATWSMAEAEKSFDELLDKALSEGPQRITRDGAAVVVVVSKEYWDSLGRKKSIPNENLESDPKRYQDQGCDAERKHFERQVWSWWSSEGLQILLTAEMLWCNVMLAYLV